MTDGLSFLEIIDQKETKFGTCCSIDQCVKDMKSNTPSQADELTYI